jgi:hypothetical protein
MTQASTTAGTRPIRHRQTKGAVHGYVHISTLPEPVSVSQVDTLLPLDLKLAGAARRHFPATLCLLSYSPALRRPTGNETGCSLFGRPLPVASLAHRPARSYACAGDWIIAAVSCCPGLKPFSPGRDTLGHSAPRRSAAAVTLTPLSRARTIPAPLALAHRAGRRTRAAPQFIDNLRLRLDALDWPCHPSDPPRKSSATQILVDICGAEH